MALTLSQLKEICDYVYNQPNEVYGSQTNPMRFYYITVSGQDTKLYKKDDDIVVIFTARNEPYTEDGEVKSYTSKIAMSSQPPTNTEEQVNWAGVGATISVKTLLRNIGIFLGVKIASNIDTVNPVMYDEMVSIVRSCVDNVNKIPYYICRDEHNGIQYLSFVPLDILVKIAIYLNNSGIFLQNKQLFNPGFYPRGDMAYWGNGSNTGLKDLRLPISYFYDIQGRDEFFNNVATFYSTLQSLDSDKIKTTLNGLVETFGSQIDFNNGIILRFHTNYVSSGEHYIVDVKEFPTTCCFDSKFRNVSDAYTFVNWYTSDTQHISNTTEDDWFIHTYSVDYETTQGIFTTTSRFVEYNKDNYVYLSLYNAYSNLKFNKIYKPYFTTFYDGSILMTLVDGFSRLQNNVIYDDLKFTGLEFLAMYNVALYVSVKDFGLELSSNDLCILGRYSSSIVLYVFRNVLSTRSSIMSTLCYNDLLYMLIGKRNGVDERLIYDYDKPQIGSAVALTNNTIEFGSTVTLEVYKITSQSDGYYNTTLLSTDNINTYNFPQLEASTVYFTLSNLGEIIEFGETKNYNGIELESGARYPTSVTDETSFMSYYVNQLYPTIGSPAVVDDVIQNARITSTWVNVSVSKTPPASQNDAFNWNLDDASEQDIAQIIKDVDASANDDDSEDDEDIYDNPDDYSEDENEGSNTIPTINDVFHYGYNAFINQWVLNTANLNEFGKAINNKDFIDLIKGLIADPLDAVISLQVVPLSLMPNYDSTARHIYIRGQELQYDTQTTTVYPVGFLLLDNVSEFDLGEIEIPKPHNNYLDVDDTSLTLFLPFAGNLELDIRDFYGGKIKIKGFCETYTGQVIYYIISEVDNLERIITTITANCFASIPLKSDGFASLINAFSRG